MLRIKFSAGRQFSASKSASSPSAKPLWVIAKSMRITIIIATLLLNNVDLFSQGGMEVKYVAIETVRHRLIYLESAYFAIPVMTIVLDFSGQFWGAIVLSFTAGILTVYELLWKIIKKEFILPKIMPH